MPQLSDLITFGTNNSQQPVSLLTAFAAFALSYFLYQLYKHRSGNAIGTNPRPDLYSIPGGVPLLGDVIFVSKRADRYLEALGDIKKHRQEANMEHKAVSLTLPGHRMIDITKPEWIEYIQKTNFANFRKGPTFFDNMHDVLGEGIFVVDGDAWNIQRKASSKMFNVNNFRGFITQSIHQELKKLRIIIGRHADAGTSFDLATLFFRFTLESFSHMAFGQNIGALSLETDKPVPFAKAFDYAQAVLNRRFNNPAWKLTERINGTSRKMKEASRTMDDFAFKIIQQREEEGLGNIKKSDKAEATDLLSLYMALRDENGKPLNKRALRRLFPFNPLICISTIGRDTTAQALSWTFFHLLLHPELMKPLQAEADEAGEVDYDNYTTLTKTLATFHEGLRLHPSVPKNIWEAIGPDSLPNGGPRIEAGDAVVWCDWEMGRMTSIWGADASEFKPSRWIDEQGQLVKESQWKYHVFNGGKRLCLGQTLAIYEASSVIASILKDFDLEFEPGWLDKVEMCEREATPRYSDSLTLPMKDPLMVRATRRKATVV
ncbi:putative cytochrome P450 monooxygenase [Meredithblackwellia eburnea MCA 4105]